MQGRGKAGAERGTKCPQNAGGQACLGRRADVPCRGTEQTCCDGGRQGEHGSRGPCHNQAGYCHADRRCQQVWPRLALPAQGDTENTDLLPQRPGWTVQGAASRASSSPRPEPARVLIRKQSEPKALRAQLWHRQGHSEDQSPVPTAAGLARGRADRSGQNHGHSQHHDQASGGQEFNFL